MTLYPNPVVSSFAPVTAPAFVPGTIIRVKGPLYYTLDTFVVTFGGLSVSAAWLELDAAGTKPNASTPAGSAIAAVAVALPLSLPPQDVVDVSVAPNGQQYSPVVAKTFTVFGVTDCT